MIKYILSLRAQRGNPVPNLQTLDCRVVLLLAITMLVASCSLWDDYERPPSKTPDNWITQADGNTWPDRDWWKSFNSNELNQLIETAAKENYDLQAATARIREADEQVRISGAALFPSLEADGSATRSHRGTSSINGINTTGLNTGTGTGTGTTTTTTGFTTNRAYASNSYEAELNASYELDFWGKNWSAKRSAEALADASRYDQETLYLSTTASVANTYFTIVATLERLKLANQNLDAANQLLTSFNKRQSVGIASALDVAQQQSVVEEQKAVIPPLELTLKQNIDALAILLGKLPEDVKLEDPNLAKLQVPTIGSGTPSELLQRRPDVVYAESNLISANANIINARAQFFPDISLTGTLGYASDTLGNLFKSGGQLFSFGANFAQPIFEGGAIFGQYEYSKARYDELLANYRKSIINAFSDSENALASYQQNDEAEKIAVESEATAARAYDLELRQYKAGIIDITTVLNTQRTLFASRDSLLQARLNHLQAAVTLYQALGGGWVDNGK